MTEFYITNNKSLQEIVDLIYDKKVVAIDTEFTREKTYYPILSLIQIAVGGKSFAVDCLADIDLQPIYNIVADAGIKKILHSCSQDLQIFHQKSQTLPQFVRDVQIAANFCGIGFNVGYSTLAQELVGVEIDKKLQRSNWQKRPLDKKQIEYALLDVVYLEEMYLKMLEILREKNRKEWFLQEMQMIDGYFIDRDENGLFKNFSITRRQKSQKQIAQIKNIILWREKKAQEKDVPRQHFMSDKDVEEIVFNENFNINLDKKLIEEIKNLIRDVDKMNIDVDLKSRRIIMNEVQKKRFNKAKNLIENIAQEQGFKEQFLMPNQALKDVVLGVKKLNEIISPWRYDLFGEKIEKIIS